MLRDNYVQRRLATRIHKEPLHSTRNSFHRIEKWVGVARKKFTITNNRKHHSMPLSLGNVNKTHYHS